MPLDSSKDNIPKTPSKSFLKRWIWVPFALILVFVVILTQIDLESVKENLIEKVSSETGMKVEVDSIGFGLSRGLGLQCKGVKVSTPEGDHYSVDRLDLLAAWSPLFRGEFQIKSAALEHPVLKLEIPKPEQPKEQPPEEKEKPVEGSGLVDSKTIKSTTEKIESNPLSIDKFVISDGEITLTRPGSTQQLLLNIDGTFVLNRDEHLDMSAKSIKVQTGSMVFEGEGSVSKLGAADAGLSLNLNSDGFSLKQLQPALQFFEVSMKESPLEAVDVDQLLIKNKFPLSALSNTELLMQKMTGLLELKIRNALLKTGHSIETLKGEGIWEKGALTHDFSGTALGSDFKINGKFPFSGLDKDAISRVEWKNLDIAKLPLPKGMAWSPSQGKVSGKLSLTGPIPKEADKLKGSVEFQAEGLVLKPANANKAQPIEISRLTGRGDFDQGQLQHDIQGAIWGSDFDLKGKLPLNADNPVLNSQINWTGLDVAQLPLPPGTGWHPTEGKVSGTLTLAGPTPAKGESFPGRLKGSLKFDAQNLKLQNADSKIIDLSTLSGDGNIENNRLHYKLKSDVFNGNILSDGNITLASTKAPVLDNQIELTNLDLSQLPLPTALEKGHVSGTIKLKGPLPDPENLLTGGLNINTNFKVTDLSMPAGKLPLNIQVLEGKANLKQGKLTHDLKGSLFDGTMKTKGSLDFHNNKTTSDIMLDNISLGWTPLFHASAPSSGTLTGNLNLKGPLPSEGKVSPELKLKGILQGEKLVFENQQIEKIKVDFSSSTSTQARVELDKIKVGERAFKKATALFKITPEKIDLTGGKIWPKNGLLQLAGDLNPKSGNYRLKFKSDKLMAEDLLQPPHLMGPLQLSGALTGTLPQNNAAPGLPDHARNLSGDIKLKLVDGAIPELGAVEGLLTLLNPTTALNAQKEGLSYDYLGGDFKIVKGVVHTENFEMKSPQVNMNVVGKANLVEDTVIAQVKAMPLQMLDKTIKAIPLLGQILGGGKKGGVIEVYVKVDGKLSQPDFMVQPHKSLTEKPGEILKGLLNIPKNLSGGE
jgi:hypothetical protein